MNSTTEKTLLPRRAHNRQNLNLQIPSPHENTYHESSLHDLEKIFDFQNDCVNMSLLKKRVIMGSLRSSPFRSLIWMLLLHVIPPNRISEWKKDLSLKRSLYDTFISCKNKVIDEYYKEMEVTINQDIERTHPRLDFFRNEHVRTTMRNILLAYSTKQSSGYRQGMHEILAILTFTFHHHQATHSHALENENVSHRLKEVLSLFHSEKIIEADLYFTFNKIMTIIYDWYIVKEEEGDDMKKQYCPGVRLVEDIYHNLLPNYSRELYEHMEKLGIIPITFGLKWTRLFYAQEFHLSDVLYIWDAIFCTSEKGAFPLVRYLFIAILLCLKDVLLIKDFSDCLCLLMRVPQEIDVMRMVNLALHYYRPTIYKKPEISTIISKSFLQAHQAKMLPNNSANTSMSRSKSMKGFQNFSLFGRPAVNPSVSQPVSSLTPRDAIPRRASLIGTPNFMNSVMDFFLPSGGQSSQAEASTDPRDDLVFINKDRFTKSIGVLRSHLDYLKKLQGSFHRSYGSPDSGTGLFESESAQADFSADIERIEGLIQLYEDCLLKPDEK